MAKNPSCFKALLIALLFSTHLSAQYRISGHVTDSIKNPVPGATLTLQEQTDTISKSSLTDAQGDVVFANLMPGTYSLAITSTGYQEKIISLMLSADTSLVITLLKNSDQLREVVVTGNKPSIENNREKTVYNVSSSVSAAGSDALTALGQVPGIKISNNEIGIAGKGLVKVMVNNQLLNLAGLDLVRFLRSISANQISKIEVIKNPSAAFDAEGNAGLINITTRRSTRAGFSGNVQGSYKRWRHNPKGIFAASNFWLSSIGGTLNYNAHKWSAYASITEDEDHELEGFETDVFYPKQTWRQTDTGDYKYHNYNIMAGVDYSISPKTVIGASFIGGRGIYDGNDHVNNPIVNNSGSLDSTVRSYATYYPVAVSNAGNIHSIIRLDSSGKKLTLNGDYFHYLRNDRSDFESQTFLPNGELSPGSRTRYFDTNKQDINVYTFKADAEIPTSFANLAFGMKLSFIDNYSNALYYDKDSSGKLGFNTSLSNEFRYKENTQAVYGSIAKQFGKWDYSAGLRLEYTRTIGQAYALAQTNVNKYLRLFPSLVLAYKNDSANIFALTVGRRINRPSFWNLNPYKSLYTAYSYAEGNPFLQPEYNTNIELSHTYRSLLVSSIFLNVTDNGFNNVTIPSADTNIVTTIPLNFIHTYRIGISESLTLRLLPWLDNASQATVYHTDARSTISYIQGVKGFGAYLSSNFTAYLSADKGFAAVANVWYQFPEVDHIGRSDPYYRVDLGIQGQAFRKKVIVALNINDIFRSSASAVTTTVNGIRTKFINFQLNRFFQISASYRFGKSESKARNETGNEEERGRIR